MNFLALLLVAGCAGSAMSAPTSAPPPAANFSEAEALGLVGMIVDTAEAHARAASPESAGPLIVDISSFLDAIHAGTGQSFSAEQLSATITRPFQNRGVAEAQICSDDGCGLIDDGVLVRLRSLQSTATGYTAELLVAWNSHRGGAIDVNVSEYTFVLQQQQWILLENRLLLAS